jgi:hypothetical protein
MKKLIEISKKENKQLEFVTLEHQLESSPYYRYINRSMGFKAINFLHDTNLTKPSGFYIGAAVAHGKKLLKEKGISQISDEFFNKEIKDKIDHSFINGPNTLKGIYTKNIFLSDAKSN